MEVVGHPGIFDILHLTYYVLGHTNSFFCLLYSIEACDLERSISVGSHDTFQHHGQSCCSHSAGQRALYSADAASCVVEIRGLIHKPSWYKELPPVIEFVENS